MRIIDKNTDFYDYLQNVYPDKSITFDRTDSFVLSKAMLCDYLQTLNHKTALHQFLLIQVCNTFWLFLITITEAREATNQIILGWKDTPTDYNIVLLSTWKNYNKKRTLISASLVDFKFNIYWSFFSRRKNYTKDDIVDSATVFKQAIDDNEYTIFKRFNKHVVRNGDGTKSIKTIPLFKACGVADYIDPLEMFLSLEEYFSLEKQANERSESIGLTDKERIENHGFSTKTSFRGKCKKNDQM